MFAGGGTGGHIYPALAIIEQIRALDPDATCRILCSDRPGDAEILNKTDIPFEPLPAKPFSLRPKGLARFLMNWGPSLRRTRELLQALKRDHDAVVLVAMGGFVAAPAARAGRREMIPVVLVNLDAVPGKANELIARSADHIYTATDVAGHDGWRRIAPIVRAATLEDRPPGPARENFGLDPDRPTLLITGGSTGATSINAFMSAYIKDRADTLAGWQVVHQGGRAISDGDLRALRDAYARAGVPAWVDRFIDDMGSAYAAADLGIGRCGAGSVAECWAARLPSLFFPYPYHKDQHQLHNARPLVDAGAAVVCTDRVDPAANLGEHADTLARLLADANARAAMRSGFEKLGRPDGAWVVAEALLNIP